MEDLKKLSYQNPIILIDGQCVLCHRFTQFLIKIDRKEILRFGNLQDFQKSDKEPDNESVTLLINGEIYKKSTASLRAMMHLGGIWKLAYILLLVPTFIRDRVYMLIAQNRYKWFGKYEECLIPKRNILVDSSS